MGTMASQITSLTIVYSTVYSGADQRKKSKLRVTAGNSPVTGEFPTLRANNAENVSMVHIKNTNKHSKCAVVLKICSNLTINHKTRILLWISVYNVNSKLISVLLSLLYYDFPDCTVQSVICHDTVVMVPYPSLKHVERGFAFGLIFVSLTAI